MSRMQLEHSGSTGTVGTLRAPGTDNGVEHLWMAWRVTQDESIRNMLLVYYLPVAGMIARRMFNRMPAGTDLDDLTQAAALGLRDAIATYDPARGVKFEHFCGTRVRGAMLDYLRSMDWAPRSTRFRLTRMNEVVSQLEMQLGHAPTDEELAVATEFSAEEITEARRDAQAGSHVRLTTEEESMEGCGLDSLPDDRPVDPEAEAQKADLREFLTKGLSRIERLVIQMYYYDCLSFREIGATLNLCESRVSQIHQSVIRLLRDRSDRIGVEE